jgi:hypothetical protein
MQPEVSANLDDDRITLSGLPRAVPAGLAAVGLIALAAGLALGWNRGDRLTAFSASYLVNFCFFLSISLGALFFVALQHLVRAGWSVAIRRLAEILAANLLVMAILFLPILLPLLTGYLGVHQQTGLYQWSDPSTATDAETLELLHHKAAYLNVPFFAVRAVVYFLVWILLARFFLQESSRQDESGDPGLTRRMEKLSAVALVLFGLTITFAAFDWLMSLEPTWYSTIFGLYYFAGSVVGFLAVLILLSMALQRRGLLTGSITTEHYHELGKLLLGFIVFWGYMAFSQYMLIWYADFPEESVWYLARQTGPWTWVSLSLLFGHLLIPFLGLLSREVKRCRVALGAWAVWMLAIHWIDVYWLVMPTFAEDRLPFEWMDVCCMFAVGSPFLAGLLWSARGRALIPLRDPRLNESLAFESF